MQAFDVTAVQRWAADKMVKVNLHDSPHLFLDVYCLEPGQSQKAHAHAGADKVYFVLAGSGRFLIGAVEADHGPGTAIVAPAGVVHGVTNPGPGRLSLLVVMGPSPNHPAKAAAGGHG